MGEAAMMFEAIDRAVEAREHVEIGRLSSQRHCRRGERGLAVEAGAAEAGPGQKVCDRFQNLAVVPTE